METLRIGQVQSTEDRRSYSGFTVTDDGTYYVLPINATYRLYNYATYFEVWG